MYKYFGLLLLVMGVSIIASIFYLRSNASHQTRTFSDYTLLISSWENYKTRFMNTDGRIIDYDQNSITTSEGQSYALLQAVWVDDKATFDKVWLWTKDTLKRPDDNLFGWRWGKRQNNQYGFLADGGDNAASDADTDIALALILANRRWKRDEYRSAAEPIIKDIWDKETVVVGNKRYLTAGNWANATDQIVINPSYFAPYAWRIFAQVDPDHDWNSLINPAYELLIQVSTSPLDKTASVGLPPDWISLSKSDATLTATKLPGLSTNYSFDAMRIPWRIAIDYRWNQEPLAKQYLSKLSFLLNTYQQQNKILASYAHNGNPIYQTESPAMYATSLGYFLTINSDLAPKIYQEKILQLYSNDTNSFRNDLPYYEENWLWFGSALYAKYLIPFQT